MSTQCTIDFLNNPQAVYYGGQILSGVAFLTTLKNKTIRAIHIEVTGRAKVKWTERKSRRGADGKTHSYTEHYRAHEQYLSSRTYVVGQNGGNSIEFPPGRYSYNFQVHLPPQLPSSFNGSHGDIHYEVKVTIDRPLRFDNEFTKAFTVISQLDLNQNGSYRMPIEISDTKEFWCGCCNVQPMKASLSIPLSGYVPGQKIPFTIFVDNESGIDCDGVKIKLEKNVRFTAHSPHTKNRYDTLKIVEKRLPRVLRQSKKVFNDSLELPAISPSSLETCSIINVSYSVTVVAKTSGCHRNLEMSVPMTIGTVPLYESATNPQNVISIQPTAPDQIAKGDTPPAYVPPILPPSYADAMSFGEDRFVDEEEVNEHKKDEPFVPKYPVYYNFATPLTGQAATDTNGATSSAPLLTQAAPQTHTGHSTAPLCPSDQPNNLPHPISSNPQTSKENNSPHYGWNAN